MNSTNIQCKICKSTTSNFDTARVLGKYSVHYFRCDTCGFIQTEEPYWLDEAYSSAITNLDVGLVNRNLQLAETVSTLIDLLYKGQGRYIDYGGGYGLFVRLMRDRGFDFYWHDPYCDNLFAKNFEADLASEKSYTLLTAFEVFEHLVDPLAAIEQMTKLAGSVLFSTFTIPDPPPRVSNWWYYAPEHGQHISLYSTKTLKTIAKRFNLHFYSKNHKLHLFSAKAIDPRLFRLATSRRVTQLWNLFRRRTSRIQADYQLALNQTSGE
jgi:2-polyprenyl-3-methyl-5-hydroxy-6-metoxy-1,4-benzoquinol methylase